MVASAAVSLLLLFFTSHSLFTPSIHQHHHRHYNRPLLCTSRTVEVLPTPRRLFHRSQTGPHPSFLSASPYRSNFYSGVRVAKVWVRHWIQRSRFCFFDWACELLLPSSAAIETVHFGLTVTGKTHTLTTQQLIRSNIAVGSSAPWAQLPLHQNCSRTGGFVSIDPTSLLSPTSALRSIRIV